MSVKNYSKFLPRSIPVIDNNRLMDRRWADQLETALNNLPPPGAGYVINGSESTFGPMYLYQGADAVKPGIPLPGSLYYALDTGNLYYESASSWQQFSPAFTGDVLKPQGSNTTTLATVNSATGTWGSGIEVPVITVDAKGRITNVFNQAISISGFSPGGSLLSVQYNSGGSFGGVPEFIYDPLGQILYVPNVAASNQVSAGSPLANRVEIQGGGLSQPAVVRSDGADTNVDLLIETRGAGNIILDAPVSVSGGVGAAGQVLTSAGAGVVPVWSDAGRTEVRFDFGDATPKPIVTLPSNTVVTATSIVILTAFDDATATLSLGDSGDPSRFQMTTDNLPQSLGTYSTEPGYEYTSSTGITLTIAPGVSTQGSGMVVVEYEK